MQLSTKQKTFPDFFGLFLKHMSTFEHFEKKDDLYSLYVSEIKDCETYY